MRTDGVRHAAANVVIVGLDDDEMGLVREVLAAEAVLPTSPIEFKDGVDAVLNGYPDVTIVAFGRSPEEAEDFARELAKERAQTTLVALLNSQDPKMILRATRAGYADAIMLPAEADHLRSVVKGAAFAVGDGENKGAIIAITGAKGGVGTSFLTAHLAAELASIHRVLVLDFDFTMGDLAPMLDIVPKDTITDLLGRASEIDERSLTGAAFVHASKVHFICQANDVDAGGEVRGDDVFAVLTAAAGAYQYIIIDCGNRLDEATTTVFNVADQIFVVATPDVVSIRDCHRKLNAFTSLGVERKRVSVLLNRVPAQPYLARDTIEHNLGITIMGQVRDDPKRVDHAINEGKLVKELYPKSDIAIDIARLVGLLSDDPEELAAAGANEAAGGAGVVAALIGRLFGGR